MAKSGPKKIPARGARPASRVDDNTGERHAPKRGTRLRAGGAVAGKRPSKASKMAGDDSANSKRGKSTVSRAVKQGRFTAAPGTVVRAVRRGAANKE